MKKIIFITLFVIPFAVFAFTESGNSGLATTVVPPNPNAGDKVTITLNGFGLDLDGSMITWQVNGAVLQKDYGAKNLSFQLGKNGSTNEVIIDVVGKKGTLKKTLIFEPAQVRLLWQANTYTPAFYRGKALASAGSNIKVLAIPTITNRSGENINSGNLNFKWSLDGDYLPNASGSGRNSFSFTSDLKGKSNTVSVIVSDANSNLSASAKVIISPQKPQIVFYENKPLTGTDYTQVLNDNYQATNEEISLKAEPYFFAYGNAGDFHYSWFINNRAVPNPSLDPSQIILRSESGSASANQIRLEIKSVSKLFQQAAKSFIVQFKSKNSNF